MILQKNGYILIWTIYSSPSYNWTFKITHFALTSCFVGQTLSRLLYFTLAYKETWYHWVFHLGLFYSIKSASCSSHYLFTLQSKRPVLCSWTWLDGISHSGICHIGLKTILSQKVLCRFWFKKAMIMWIWRKFLRLYKFVHCFRLIAIVKIT